MIVLTRRFPNGEESSCTARCYNSTYKKCTCICKGLLHGKGEAYAMANAYKAATYLHIYKREYCDYFPACELVQDVQGR